MGKPYVVVREQPDGSSNYYKYLYTNVRKNNKHTTECLQYLGKADGPEDKSVSKADLDDEIIQEYDVDVQDIVEGNIAEDKAEDENENKNWDCFIAMDNKQAMGVIDNLEDFYKDEIEKGIDLDIGNDVKYVGMSSRIKSMVKNELKKMEDTEQ